MSAIANRLFLGLALAAMLVVLAPGAFAQWVHFENQTATRVNAPAARFVSDPEEKDYAWGDLDHDGDLDLVVVRKQPWTSPGKKPNYLFINQNGVLTDRTTDFASASDVSGDQGFNTPTNDRDVYMIDVDLDGWLDVITATTISDGDPKYIGHPRVYHNRGCTTQPCNTTTNWLGLKFENNRIPTMLSATGQSGFNPRFCSVAAGDVTGDGYPDLWFGDYDSSGAGGNSEPPGADFDDRLLINYGTANGGTQKGYFFDATLNPGSHFSGTISIPQNGTAPFPKSAFGAAAAIADMNSDGVKDIVKQTSLNAPQYVGIGYNNPASQGFFSNHEVVSQLSPYFVSLGDLNNDNKLDMVITDDGPDRYLLNEGNGADGRANFTSYAFSFSNTGGVPPNPSSDDGFGSQSIVADLDKDGWKDVLIADVDVDISGCLRRTHIYHNLGGTVGGFVTLKEQTTGSGCSFAAGNPASCLVTGIPSNMLEGTHNIAVMDINNDTWPDLVIGRCNTSEVWMNIPPAIPAGSTPDGDNVPGTELLLNTADGGRIELSWGDSCDSGDNDYSVYQGTLNGTFNNHTPVSCTTFGLNSLKFVPAAGDAYYLVVPHNGTYEGSYGYASNGTPHTQGAQACHPMLTAPCQ